MPLRLAFSQQREGSRKFQPERWLVGFAPAPMSTAREVLKRLERTDGGFWRRRTGARTRRQGVVRALVPTFDYVALTSGRPQRRSFALRNASCSRLTEQPAAKCIEGRASHEHADLVRMAGYTEAQSAAGEEHWLAARELEREVPGIQVVAEDHGLPVGVGRKPGHPIGKLLDRPTDEVEPSFAQVLDVSREARLGSVIALELVGPGYAHSRPACQGIGVASHDGIGQR